MWPFTKEKEHKPNRTQECIEKLKAFRDIGQTFNYLGRVCVVTAHDEFYPYIGKVPLLKFDYADDHGVIHCMSAKIHELPALINQQVPNVELTGSAPLRSPG